MDTQKGLRLLTPATNPAQARAMVHSESGALVWPSIIISVVVKVKVAVCAEALTAFRLVNDDGQRKYWEKKKKKKKKEEQKLMV